MATIHRCDGCGTETPCSFDAAVESGVLYLDEHRAPPRHFCGWSCLATYATAKMLVDGATEAGP
jgi:hypothetical protein